MESKRTSQAVRVPVQSYIWQGVRQPVTVKKKMVGLCGLCGRQSVHEGTCDYCSPEI